IEDLPKARIRSDRVGKSKIGMIEEIEKLKTDGEHAIFPMGNFRVFHERQVRGDIARPPKTVAALRKCHKPTIAHAGCAQMSGVEASFATRLHKQGCGIGRVVWGKHFRGQTRNRAGRKGRTFAAWSRVGKGSNRYGTIGPKNVVIHQVAGLGKVSCAIRESGA